MIVLMEALFIKLAHRVKVWFFMFPELQCPTKCAVGMIRREVSCSRIDESGNLTIIDPEFCRYMNKPLSEMKCNENKPCGCKLLYFVLVSRRRKENYFRGIKIMSAYISWFSETTHLPSHWTKLLEWRKLSTGSIRLQVRLWQGIYWRRVRK